MDVFPVTVAVVKATLVEAATTDALPDVDAADAEAATVDVEVATLAVMALADVDTIRTAAVLVDESKVATLAPVVEAAYADR